MSNSTDGAENNGKKPEPKWLRPLTEYGPLAAFMGAYWYSDLMLATQAVVVATILALALAYLIARRVPMLPLVTAGLVVVFGGLTLWLKDETFIKMKPTIVQLLFAVILFGGLALGRHPLRLVLKGALTMGDAAWRTLTVRFGLFFIVMAVVNEAVWRTQSTDFWVNFKVFGILGLTLLFSFSQAPFIARATAEAEADTEAEAGTGKNEEQDIKTQDRA